MIGIVTYVKAPRYPAHDEDCPVLCGVPMCVCGATLRTAQMIDAASKMNKRLVKLLGPDERELGGEAQHYRIER